MNFDWGINNGKNKKQEKGIYLDAPPLESDVIASLATHAILSSAETAEKQ